MGPLCVGPSRGALPPLKHLPNGLDEMNDSPAQTTFGKQLLISRAEPSPSVANREPCGGHPNSHMSGCAKLDFQALNG